jgi:hypothetical protein
MCLFLPILFYSILFYPIPSHPIPSYLSICLLFCHYHAVFVPMTLQYNLKFSIVIPSHCCFCSELLWLFGIFFLLIFFYCFYIYLHVYTLFEPPSPTPSPASWQNLFCPLVLQFCWRKNLKDNKEKWHFLLVWDKDSYTGRFFLNLNWFISTRSLHYFLVPLP